MITPFGGVSFLLGWLSPIIFIILRGFIVGLFYLWLLPFANMLDYEL
jgi:uncharacterized membrane protein YgdD (TMEM256/DUF423 family)